MRRYAVIAAFSLFAALTSAQYAPLLEPHQYFVNGSGAPCAGCSLYTYAAGTTTPQATYLSSTGPQNTNPIILDITGSANIWGSSSAYKLQLVDAVGSTVWTADNIPGVAPVVNYLPLTGGALSGPLSTNSAITSTYGGTDAFSGPITAPNLTYNTQVGLNVVSAVGSPLTVVSDVTGPNDPNAVVLPSGNIMVAYQTSGGGASYQLLNPTGTALIGSPVPISITVPTYGGTSTGAYITLNMMSNGKLLFTSDTYSALPQINITSCTIGASTATFAATNTLSAGNTVTFGVGGSPMTGSCSGFQSFSAQVISTGLSGSQFEINWSGGTPGGPFAQTAKASTGFYQPYSAVGTLSGDTPSWGSAQLVTVPAGADYLLSTAGFQVSSTNITFATWFSTQYQNSTASATAIQYNPTANTWGTVLSPAIFPGPSPNPYVFGYSEASIVRYSNGDCMFLGRHDTNDPDGAFTRGASHDGTCTSWSGWTDAVPTDVIGSSSYNSTTRIGLPSLLVTTSSPAQQTLLVSRCTLPSSAITTCGRVSLDEGFTWSPPVDLKLSGATNAGYYNGLVLTQGGTIGLLETTNTGGQFNIGFQTLQISGSVPPTPSYTSSPQAIFSSMAIGGTPRAPRALVDIDASVGPAGQGQCIYGTGGALVACMTNGSSNGGIAGGVDLYRAGNVGIHLNSQDYSFFDTLLAMCVGQTTSANCQSHAGSYAWDVVGGTQTDTLKVGAMSAPLAATITGISYLDGSGIAQNMGTQQSASISVGCNAGGTWNGGNATIYYMVSTLTGLSSSAGKRVDISLLMSTSGTSFCTATSSNQTITLPWTPATGIGIQELTCDNLSLGVAGKAFALAGNTTLTLQLQNGNNLYTASAQNVNCHGSLFAN